MLRRSFHTTAVGSSSTRTNRRTNSNTNIVGGGDEQYMEMLRAEYRLRALRPKPPMSSKHHQPQTTYIHSQRPSSTQCKSIEEPTLSELMKILDQRENDLVVAARHGASLLDQNRELQEKNEFLEESLVTSSETITQQTKLLRQKGDIIHRILAGDLDEEEQQQFGLGTSIRFEHKIRQLADENNKLQAKTSQLEELKAIVEKREEQRINAYISQLRAANLKVAQMQVDLCEKTRHCEVQAEEVQKLLNEIEQRKSRRKMLLEQNVDLDLRLYEAQTNHDQLVAEHQGLQDEHFNLIMMLRESEDELKTYREKELAIVPPRRSNSTDSLYDSLASELEGADSGCYNTPIFTARYGPSPHWSLLSNGAAAAVDQQQPCCSASTDQSFEIAGGENPFFHLESLKEANETVEEQQQHQNHYQQSFDIPSRALLEAVRSTFDDRRKFRISQQQQKSLDLVRSEEEEQNTPMASDEKTIVKEEGTPIRRTEEVATTPKKKIFRDVSCSPIQFSALPPDISGREWVDIEVAATPSTPSTQRSGGKHSSAATTKQPASPSTASVDSLDGYSPPKLGVPGRPGTRDLDHRIRGLGLRKESTDTKNPELGGSHGGQIAIDENYKRFRASKGLPPANFYAPFAGDESRSPSNQLKRISQLRLLQQPNKMPNFAPKVDVPTMMSIDASLARLIRSQGGAVFPNGVVGSSLAMAEDRSSLARSPSCHASIGAVRRPMTEKGISSLVISSSPTGRSPIPTTTASSGGIVRRHDCLI